MKVEFGATEIDLTGPVHDGICVRQEFVAKSQKLISVEIYFATYMRENPGIVVVDVRDSRRRMVAQAQVDSVRLEDNSMREFGLAAPLRIGGKYELRVYTQGCRSGMAPTCACGSKTEGGPLFLGARVVRDKELNCIFNYEKIDPRAMPQSPKGAESVRSPVPHGAVEGLISVVIPHYNCDDLLVKCLVSLSRQTYSCIEVIVVDDGSEPDCVERVESSVEAFKALLPSLRSFGFRENRGACAARNFGADEARGEYLFFCDADVELYPEALEILVRCLLKDGDASFAYGGFMWGAQRVLPVPFDVHKLRDSNFVTTMSLMRASVYPGWDEDLKRHQDWDMWLTITDNGYVGVCCGEYLFETPVREGISTSENIDMEQSIDIVKRKHAPKASVFAGHGVGLISVVVPCYNDESFLPELFESIEKQTYNHYSVVVVDDGSDDGQAVMDVCKFCGFHVEYRRNPSRLGASEARNVGLEERSGEFVFFCDSDVILSPACFREHVQALHENPDCAWSYSNFKVGDEERSFYPFNANGMYSRNCSSTMSMVRSSVGPYFNPKLRRLQDWDMFLTLVEKGHKGVWIDKFLFFAYDRPGITKSSITWDEAVKEMMNHHER